MIWLWPIRHSLSEGEKKTKKKKHDATNAEEIFEENI